MFKLPGAARMTNGAPADTTTEKVAECVRVPLVAVTVIVLLPMAAPDEAAIWNEDPVTGPVGVNDGMLTGTIATPAGSPEIVRLIVPLNPFVAFAEIN
ncbi:MAG TPA: hypothetical protein VE866_04460 [Candidatus Binatia bacterium]|nr:hypothetical protein [Candidatus Binatia bacterium]